ncbi:MAG: hypothetical protein JXR63_10725 [Spirochaetales bacterium]|nr:hypothetical protein [Spirochaetales bacterium]
MFEARKKLRLCVYPGNERPKNDPDFAFLLVKKLMDAGHEVVVAYIHSNDTVASDLEELGVEVRILPQMMNSFMSKIKSSVEQKDELYQEFLDFISQQESLELDLGIEVLGKWMPPVFFNLPRLGFINYHPGPLPRLKGSEPDTFAILEGWKEIWGTVHEITENMDDGGIVGFTKKISLDEYSTPLEVYKDLMFHGIDSLASVADEYYEGKNKILTKPFEKESWATLSRAYNFSWIKSSDTLAFVNRKFRAFCGQNINIKLKVKLEERIFEVVNMETFLYNHNIESGKVIGHYHGSGFYSGAPIYTVRDGFLLLKLGVEIPESQLWINTSRKAESSNAQVIDFRHKPKIVDSRLVLQEVNNYLRHLS